MTASILYGASPVCVRNPRARGRGARRSGPLLAVALAAALGGEAVAATWYVAPGGDDRDAGTAAAPFASWQRAVDAVRPGDSIEIAAGTYRPQGFRRDGVRISRSGTAAAPVTLRSAPGVRAVLDCSRLRYDQTMYCLLVQGSWWRIARIEVRGIPQPTAQSNSAGILIAGTTGVTLDSVTSARHGGKGVLLAGDAQSNTLRNVDAHDNYDPLTGGGNADGIAASFLAPTATGNRIVGARSWDNSDDGIDLWEAEAAVTVDRSWAFGNGYVPGTTIPAGDGDGFKLGRNAGGPAHVITRNLAFDNRTRGFDANGATGSMLVANNTAIRNGLAGFSFLQPQPHRLRNNVDVGAGVVLNPAIDQRANSWTLGLAVTAADFRSLSASGTAGPRQANGALPDLPFARPGPGSHLRDRGIPVGLPFAGPAPDLGAYEAPTPPR